MADDYETHKKKQYQLQKAREEDMNEYANDEYMGGRYGGTIRDYKKVTEGTLSRYGGVDVIPKSMELRYPGSRYGDELRKLRKK